MLGGAHRLGCVLNRAVRATVRRPLGGARVPCRVHIVMDLQLNAPALGMDELGRGRRIGILLICCMSLLIVGLDVTIVNVALPSIGHDLGASVPGRQWTIDAVTLVLAGSLLCSIPPSLGLLIVFRMLQMVGGSTLNPVAILIITNTFTDPKERS